MHVVRDVFQCKPGRAKLLAEMFETRLRTKRAIGYARGEAPLGLVETAEPSVENDEEDPCPIEEEA
jgi:hypothetical protein